MAKLVVNPGSPVAWEIQLKQGINLIGRGFDNDFKIADPSVSGSHCQITLTGQTVVIKDLGSTNGTYVNRSPVREATLQNGQVIHLGGVEMLFRSDAGSQQASAARAIPEGRLIPTPPPPSGVPSVASPAPAVWQTTGPQVAPLAQPVGGQPAALVQPIGGQAAALGQLMSAETERIPRPTTVPTPPSPKLLVGTSSASAPPLIGARATTTSPQVSGPAPSGAPASAQRCKFHPKTFARFFCSKCNHCFCELCVTSRAIGGVQRKTCRQCGTELAPLQVKIERPVQAGFYARLGGAFAYPFRGSGIFLMLIGILLFSGLKYGGVMVKLGTFRTIGGGLLLYVFAGGYLFTFLQSIIHSTAAEDREMPDLPGMSNIADDILLPFLRLLGLSLICFGPTAALAIWVGPSAGYAAAVFGGLYFPMAFLAVVILDSAAAANPLVIIPSILKVPLEYLVTILLLAFVYGLGPLGDIIIGAAFPRGLLSHSMAEMFAYLGACAFWGFFSFYLLIVAVHILGLLYVSKKDKLGWLDR